jgi:hypothetical protein
MEADSIRSGEGPDEGRNIMWCKPALVVVTFALSSAGGIAAEIPKSGTVEGRFYSHGVQTIDELETADGMKAYINQSFEFHVGNQPNDPFNGSIRCLGYGRYSDSGAIWEVDRCTGIDADNDKFYEEIEVNLTGPEDKNPVHGKILGGTGKYKGVKGTITAIGNAWPSLSKADSMFAGQYKWEYKIGD